jgi:hypothetical protein
MTASDSQAGNVAGLGHFGVPGPKLAATECGTTDKQLQSRLSAAQGKSAQESD